MNKADILTICIAGALAGSTDRFRTFKSTAVSYFDEARAAEEIKSWLSDEIEAAVAIGLEATEALEKIFLGEDEP